MVNFFFYFAFKGNKVITMCNKNKKTIQPCILIMTNESHGKDLPTPETKLNDFVNQGKNSNFDMKIHNKI